MADPWQVRRSRFNHDWLKNSYLPALAKWVNLSDGLLEDTGFEEEFLGSIFPQWTQQSMEALDLIETFSRDMSPRVLMNEWIFTNLNEETRKWLAPLIHRLWLNRNPVRAWQSEAKDAVNEANMHYKKLQAMLLERKEESHTALITAGERDLADRFSTFRASCQTVARCVESFPSKVQAV